MQRLAGNVVLPILAAVFLSAMAACRQRPEKVSVETTEEQPETLLSAVHVADPRSSAQLLKGFHDVEQNAWRWTMRKFSVVLGLPAGSSDRGATLELRFSIPETLIDRLKSITLTANVEGTPLPAETYTKPGEFTYTQDVPAKALRGEAAVIDFELDKALPPSAADQRELGVVVSAVGLEAK